MLEGVVKSLEAGGRSCEQVAFASVVEVPQTEMLDAIGPSLVVSAITEDKALIDDLLGSPKVERLNIGPLGTHVVSWDQPHEGNLFEHLYVQRAFQRAS